MKEKLLLPHIENNQRLSLFNDWKKKNDSNRYKQEIFLPIPSPVIGLPKVPRHSRSPSECSSIFEKTALGSSFGRENSEKTSFSNKLKLNTSVKLNPIRHLVKPRKRIEPCDIGDRILKDLDGQSKEEEEEREMGKINSATDLELMINKVPKDSFSTDREEKYFRVFSVYRSSDKILEQDRIGKRESSDLSKFIELFKEKETSVPLELAVINETNKKNEFILR